jgi:2,3-bisphosphoglycerate-independent phosphoglycerate mutase
MTPKAAKNTTNGATVLIVMDGFGQRKDRHSNAIALARTPNLDRLRKEFPTTELEASGLDVGLPAGQMGNSEVGHLNLGAGRVVYQDVTKISRAVESGELESNEPLKAALQAGRQSALHLIGLVSDGGVHSSIDHLLALIKAASEFGVRQLYIHAITDGRDTPPKSALTYLRQLETACLRYGTGEVASVIGRFYAMDRDQRWERVARAYQALVKGEGQGTLFASSAEKAVAAAYARGETDEFLQPTVIGEANKAKAVIGDGDSVIFFNFRADRARELTRAFTAPRFDGFVRQATPKLDHFVCMTSYDDEYDLPVMFPREPLKAILGEVIAKAQLRQARIAETEKYAHVTYFFNGGAEIPFGGEDRVLVPSPRDVETYDKMPEMSLSAVAKACVDKVNAKEHAFILVNFANPDMVGHTGNLDAAIRAVEEVDRAVGTIVQATLEARGRVIVTSDHGNCETMVDSESGEPHTAHTTNPVPFILVDPALKGARLRKGALADVAPTILQLMELNVPKEMTGKTLIDRRSLSA